MPTEPPKAGASESKAPETWRNPDFFPQRMKIFERGLVGGEKEVKEVSFVVLAEVVAIREGPLVFECRSEATSR